MNLTLVAAFLISLWTPLWWQQRVNAPPVSEWDVEEWRYSLEPSVANALWELAFDWDQWRIRGTDIVGQADQIVNGQLSLAARPAVTMKQMDWWADPYQDARWRLQFQGLRHVRILLAAWHITGRQIYLSKAQEVIVSWISFSKRWPFGGGYMWNDQATGDRAVIFSAFWAAYARSSTYDPAIALEVLRSLGRHIAFLADPRHFTALTSHGLLENVALLHAAATLPMLAERAKAVDVAVRRITLQYRMLETPEGVWTEHAPGYQLHAVNLRRSASAYLGILGRRPPEEWTPAQLRLEKTLVQMARHDGSLPPLGDTVERPESGHLWPSKMLDPVKNRTRAPEFVATCGGYVVLWDDRPEQQRQVVMTVSNFRGHSHKHADELSTYLFSDGISWLTGPGYWPYVSPRRPYASGWTAANAPAYEGEPEESDRSATLLAYGRSNWGDFVEMERSGPAGFRAKRQVAWVRPDWLIVADQVSAPGGGIVLRWLLSPDVLVDGSSDKGWTARAIRGPTDRRLRLWVMSETPSAVTVRRGSERPFRGWVYLDEKVSPAPAFEIKPAGNNAFVVSVMHLESGPPGTTTVTPRLKRSGDKWSISVGQSFELSSDVATQPLKCQPEVRQAYRSLRTALVAEYGSPKGSVLLSRYRQVTLLVIAAWLLQEISLIVIKRWAPRLVVVIRMASCLVLIAGAVFFYVRWSGSWVY